jgi:hypothetical protein
VLDAARAVGLDADAIAAEAGIDPAWLADPDSRVPLDPDRRSMCGITSGCTMAL